jgi:hypothetical protein
MKETIVEGKITRIALRPPECVTSFVRINDSILQFQEANQAILGLLALSQPGDEVELKIQLDDYFKDAKPVLVRIHNRTLNEVAEYTRLKTI